MSNATTLPLSEMTRVAKLRAMEELWDDLCHLAEGVSSPAWHGEILAERLQRVASGEAQFHEREDVKERLLAPKQ